jgi:hypothetical protein
VAARRHALSARRGSPGPLYRAISSPQLAGPAASLMSAGAAIPAEVTARKLKWITAR